MYAMCAILILTLLRTGVSAGNSIKMSVRELLAVGSVDYNVTVTNTGKKGGATAVLAFVGSDVCIINNILYSAHTRHFPY